MSLINVQFFDEVSWKLLHQDYRTVCHQFVHHQSPVATSLFSDDSPSAERVQVVIDHPTLVKSNV
jgi:hypothetical protein